MVKRSYNQFCPLARSLDAVGERWSLLLIRELVRGPRRYMQLREALPGVASNLLSTRLHEMQDMGLIAKSDQPALHNAYELTDRGRELRAVLLATSRFGLAYLDAPTEEQPLPVELLPESLLYLLRLEELPPGSISIRFKLDEADITVEISADGPPGERLVPIDRITSEFTDHLPPTHPEIMVESSIAVLLWIRRGELAADVAMTDGLLRIEADQAGRTLIARLFGFSHILQSAEA